MLTSKYFILLSLIVNINGDIYTIGNVLIIIIYLLKKFFYLILNIKIGNVLIIRCSILFRIKLIIGCVYIYIWSKLISWKIN